MNIKHKSPVLWETKTWPELQQLLQTIDTVILPCGAIEQHGPHLPVDIDYFDAVHLSILVAEGCQEPRPLVLPAIPFGVSYHHEDFKGTIELCVRYWYESRQEWGEEDHHHQRPRR